MNAINDNLEAAVANVEELDIEPLTKAGYKKNQGNWRMLKKIHAEIAPKLDALLKARQAVYRGFDDYYNVPKMARCKSEEQAQAIEAMEEQAQACKAPEMDKQVLCQFDDEMNLVVVGQA